MIIDELIRVFEVSFGHVSGKHALRVHAPGCSEISGNHTDHEGGHVIAASLDVAVDGIACTNGTETVRVASKGYPLFEVGLATFRQNAANPRAAANGSGSGTKRCKPWPGQMANCR